MFRASDPRTEVHKVIYFFNNTASAGNKRCRNWSWDVGTKVFSLPLVHVRGDGECSDISRGGGSVIYVKDYINPKLCSSFNAHDSLVVSIQCDIGAIHLACVYRSQALTGAQNKHLINSLKKLSVEHPDDEIIIVGDLNLPDVCWVTGTVRGSSETRSRVLQLQKDYVDLITDLGLTWHITDEITRRRVVSGFLQESTLDQVITS